MKKRSMMVLLLSLLATFVSANGTQETTAKKTTEKYVIANAPKCVGIAWWDRMKEGNDQFMKETGNEVYQVGNAGAADTAVQVQTIEDIIASGADAITVIPSDPAALEPILAKARKQGIVVISHEAENMANVDYDVEAFNNKDYGAHVMDNLAAEMGKKGGYAIIMGGLTMVSHQQWTEGAIERQKAAYPDMTLVCDPVEGGSIESTYQVAKELIAKYPNLQGIIGWDMLNPPGIARAVEEANKVGKIAVTGTCLVSVCGDYLKSGTIKTISFWDPAAAGRAMCSLAVKVLNKEAITDGMDLQVPGYEKIILRGNTVVGAAWVDATVANMAGYNF
jgi:simple sugar transport system substrate-binding protein